MKPLDRAGPFLLMAVLFLIANRGAYKGYFSDDELDNLSWAPYVPLSDYATALATPRFMTGQFPPRGPPLFPARRPAVRLGFSRSTSSPSTPSIC